MTKLTIKAPKGTINVPDGKGGHHHFKHGDPVPEKLEKRALREGWGEDTAKESNTSQE